MERRALLDDRLHRREACDRAGRQRPHRPGRDGVDADVLLPQVPREVLHRGVERGLCDAHHVVVRYRALAAEVRHRQDRAAAAGLHERLGQARAGDEGVSRDVERQPETVARRVGEAALKILGGGERDRVHEQVEATVERLANLAEDALEVPVGADIALGDERRAHGLGELANVLLDPLSLVGEGELGTSLREPARDRPRDRAAVCDAENQAALARECPFHGRESMAEFSATLRLLRRSLVLVCSAALVLATAATAQLKPIRLPHKGDRTLPRVRDGVIRVPAVRRIYPSLGYRLDTNKSPSVIHADQFWANTGGLGDGVKIGVVDDGIDAANPFFNPAGFSYPAGFPKGQRKFTTPKVIVARAFPGPGSGKQGRLPLYRDDFGLGSVGSPSNAPDAISVAAVSNVHVFGPELNVTAAGAPPETQHIPFMFNGRVPPSWPQFDHILVDVATITGTDGQPVDRRLCAAGDDPNDPTRSPLPSGSLGGTVALVSRGGCTFDSTAQRVPRAGGTGIVLA